MRDYGVDTLTEISLALAMAFFCVMVLTLLSLPNAEPRAGAAASGALLLPAAAPSSAVPALKPGPQDLVFLYAHGRFFDLDAKPATPPTRLGDKRVILAVDPAAPLAEVMAARARFATDNLIVSSLDARWLSALER